jgi:hypothetical protein
MPCRRRPHGVTASRASRDRRARCRCLGLLVRHRPRRGGNHLQGYDLQLTQHDHHGGGRRSTRAGWKYSLTGATGAAWERTPWRATQRAVTSSAGPAWCARRRARLVSGRSPRPRRSSQQRARRQVRLAGAGRADDDTDGKLSTATAAGGSQHRSSRCHSSRKQERSLLKDYLGHTPVLLVASAPRGPSADCPRRPQG